MRWRYDSSPGSDAVGSLGLESRQQAEVAAFVLTVTDNCVGTLFGSS